MSSFKVAEVRDCMTFERLPQPVGVFINLKFMTKILDRINSIRAVSSNDRSTLLSRFLGIKHVRMHSGNKKLSDRQRLSQSLGNLACHIFGRVSLFLFKYYIQAAWCIHHQQNYHERRSTRSRYVTSNQKIVVLRSNSHLSECRTSHETFFTWRGSEIFQQLAYGVYMQRSSCNTTRTLEEHTLYYQQRCMEKKSPSNVSEFFFLMLFQKKDKQI